MSEWQPIESAPKDGVPIMGCFWQPELAHLYSPRRIFWAAYHPNAAGKTCWRDAPFCGNKLERLTHWMPLPAAPGIEVESAACNVEPGPKEAPSENLATKDPS